MFSTGDEQQWELIKKQIDDCDYYVVISAFRYGSLDGDISYTEKEYDYSNLSSLAAGISYGALCFAGLLYFPAHKII